MLVEIIRFNRRRFWKYLLFLPLLAAMLYLGVSLLHTDKGIRVGGLVYVIKTLGIALVPLGYLYRITILYIKKAPGVVLTDKTIKINYTGYCIPWTDITHISKSESNGPFSSSYASIFVRDPWKHVRESRNPFLKYFRWHTRKWRDTLFEVNLSSLDGDEDEVYHKILWYYQTYRGF